MTGSLRQRIIGMTLLLVGVAWGIDRLTGGANPQRAQASVSKDRQHPGASPSGEPAIPLNQILNATRSYDTQRPPLRLTRDLFADPVVGRALAAADNAAPASKHRRDSLHAAGRDAPAADPPEPPMALNGIIKGRTPMAIINGRIVGVGDQIEQYRIVRVERDRVILVGPSGRRVLTLPQPNVAGD